MNGDRLVGGVRELENHEVIDDSATRKACGDVDEVVTFGGEDVPSEDPVSNECGGRERRDRDFGGRGEHLGGGGGDDGRDGLIFDDRGGGIGLAGGERRSGVAGDGGGHGAMVSVFVASGGEGGGCGGGG